MGRLWQSLALLSSLSLGFIISHFGLYNNLLLPASSQGMLHESSTPWQHLVTVGAGPCSCSVIVIASVPNSAPINAIPSINCSCVRNETEWVADHQTVTDKPSLCNEKKGMDTNSQQTVVQNVVKYEPWYAENRTWHYPMRIPRCSMDVCFNYSKCEGAEEVLVYSYDTPIPPVRYFSRINESKWHTEDPEKACLFFVFLDLDTPYRPDLKKLQHWSGGMNHVLITFADMWRQRGPAEDTIGFASVMASDMHETTYRAGFDISIPLPGNYHMKEFQGLKPFDRQYLLTFRGLRYLGKSGEGTFRSHESFRAIHNGIDVIVATSCKHFINNLKRQESPELGAHCDEDDAIYPQYSFHDLMNSTFGLVPAGIQPNSYRFAEVLAAGTIPVLIADNYVKPFDTLIQWHRCLLQFPTTQMHRIVQTVRSLRREEVEKRQKYCLKVFNEFLKDEKTLLRAAMVSLEARFLGMFPVRGR